jgi:hypothetical protein
MTYRDALFALAQAVPNLNERDAAFAKSLLDQAHSPYSDAVPLSMKQWEWVRKLADKAKAPPAAPAASFAPIVELFAKAGGKFPAIVFEADDGTAFRLSRAGAASKAPGTINVTDTAKGFDAKTWFGRIGLDGAFQASNRVAPATMASVTAALAAFAANPAGQAAAHGHKTGSCCFCGLTLTDQRSVTVGYGPICAERWGLPWGEAS